MEVRRYEKAATEDEMFGARPNVVAARRNGLCSHC